MAGEGAVIMTPSSISFTGTSASIQADGGVIATGVTLLSLNDVFTSAYKNYYMTVEHEGGGTGSTNYRFGSSGSFDSGSNYYWTYSQANGNTFASERLQSQQETRLSSFGADAGGTFAYICSPYLTERTVSLTLASRGSGTARFFQVRGVHSQEVSYDGISFIPSSGLDMVVYIYGLEC